MAIPTTGVIDHEVAAYWREHYDLRDILERDWATLGPKVRGKIDIYVGDMDTWYLNNAVYPMEAFLKKAANPSADAVVEDRRPRRALLERARPGLLVPQLREADPRDGTEGADITSWRY